MSRKTEKILAKDKREREITIREITITPVGTIQKGDIIDIKSSVANGKFRVDGIVQSDMYSVTLKLKPSR